MHRRNFLHLGGLSLIGASISPAWLPARTGAFPSFQTDWHYFTNQPGMTASGKKMPSSILQTIQEALPQGVEGRHIQPVYLVENDQQTLYFSAFELHSMRESLHQYIIPFWQHRPSSEEPAILLMTRQEFSTLVAAATKQKEPLYPRLDLSHQECLVTNQGLLKQRTSLQDGVYRHEWTLIASTRPLASGSFTTRSQRSFSTV